MKSKMKTTFALIAVALMVMVAVVPMIGVFTDDSDAATIVIPDTDNNIITVKVDVKGANGQAATSLPGNVKIAYGNYTQLASPGTSGSCTFTIREATVASLTASYVDETGNPDTNYPSVTLTTLSAGNTYTATLKAGKVLQKVSFSFNNNKAIADLLTAGTSTLTASYTIYDALTGGNKITDGAFTIASDFTGTFEIPYANASGTAYTTVYVVVTALATTNPDITVTYDVNARQSVTIGSTVTALKAQQDLVTITPASNVYGQVTITELTGTNTPSGQDPVAITMNTIKNTMVYTTVADPAYYTAIIPTTGVNAFKMNLSADGTTATDVPLTISSGSATYTPANAFFGTIAMNSTYVQSGTLTANIKSGETTVGTIANATVSASGKFFQFVTLTGTGSTISDITFTSAGVNFVPTTSSSYSGTSPITFSVPATGYSQVSGTLKLGNASGAPGLVGETIIVTGTTVKTFGSLVTTTGGSFTFMATTGANIVLSVASATLSGDTSIVPGSSSTSKVINMNSQAVSVKVQDALGNAITGATVILKNGTDVVVTADGSNKFTYDSTSKSYKADIQKDLTATALTVVVTATGYTFTDALYTEGKIFSAAEADYKFTFKASDGTTVLTSLTASDVSVYVTSIYKNTANSVIYDQITKVTPTVSAGVFTLAKQKATLTGAAVPAAAAVQKLVIFPENGAMAAGSFDKVYYVDADGETDIVSAADSLIAHVYKLNGTTALAGAKVTVGTGINAENAVTVYTDADGKFTANLPQKIDSSTKVFITLKGYVFKAAGYDAMKDGVKVTTYKAEQDKYTFTYKDADNETYKPVSGDLMVSYDGGEAVSLADGSYAWAAGKTIQVTSSSLLRTFQPIELTAAMVAAGTVTITSEQSTYTVTVKDKATKPVYGATVDVYAKYNGTAYDEVPEGIPFMGPCYTEADGTVKIAVTALTNSILAAEHVTGFAVVVTKTGMKFTTEPTALDPEGITITATESTTSTVSFYILDAEGLPLANDVVYAGDIKYYADGVEYTPTGIVFDDGMLTFNGDSAASYEITLPDLTNAGGTYKYTFEKKQVPVLGALFANEEWIYGSVCDADGASIAAANNKTVTAYYGDKAGATTKYVNTAEAGDYFAVLADADKVTAVGIENFGNYHFEKSETTTIVADESTVGALFTAINGTPAKPTAYTITAYDADGKVMAAPAASIVIDTDKAVLYKLTVATASADDGYFPAGSYYSEANVFVSPYSKVTGTLPVAAADGDVVALDMYEGGRVVDTVVVELDNGDKTYTTYIDLSEYTPVAAVAFDSMTATYVHNGAVYGVTVVDPTSAYNPIIVPPEPVITELGSELILMHYSAAIIDGYVVLAADQIFDVVIGTTQVEGKQLVDRYTFAGWYINGTKVSTTSNFAIEALDNNAVYADYSVETIEVVAPQPEPTPEPAPADNSIDPTVLVIGICAVIVALIAVAYAVIASRPKEKKE